MEISLSFFCIMLVMLICIQTLNSGHLSDQQDVLLYFSILSFLVVLIQSRLGRVLVVCRST